MGSRAHLHPRSALGPSVAQLHRQPPYTTPLWLISPCGNNPALSHLTGHLLGTDSPLPSGKAIFSMTCGINTGNDSVHLTPGQGDCAAYAD